MVWNRFPGEEVKDLLFNILKVCEIPVRVPMKDGAVETVEYM